MSSKRHSKNNERDEGGGEEKERKEGREGKTSPTNKAFIFQLQDFFFSIMLGSLGFLIISNNDFMF